MNGPAPDRGAGGAGVPAAGVRRAFQGSHGWELPPDIVSRVLPFLALLAALVLGVGPITSGLAATADEVRELARRAISDPEIQRDLPLAGPGEATEQTRGEPPDGAIDSSRGQRQLFS